jgi:hypothetical protein
MEQQLRQIAISRYLQGEKPISIYTELKLSNTFAEFHGLARGYLLITQVLS